MPSILSAPNAVWGRLFVFHGGDIKDIELPLYGDPQRGFATALLKLRRRLYQALLESQPLKKISCSTAPPQARTWTQPFLCDIAICHPRRAERRRARGEIEAYRLIPVENHPQRRSFWLAEYHPPLGGGC